MTTTKSPVTRRHSASNRLREQAGVVARDVQGMGSIARDAAQEQLGHIQESASDLCEQGRDKARSASRSLEQYIAEKPLTSMLIASGVGLLLGRLWKRH